MNIEELEYRYQVLLGDFQSGKIDEATFTSQVDVLQFQDNWGRYWMIGAQTGTWHYYDGQAWHQADPREADKLPFIDEQGRYWQRGAKSGDWYYYQPDTGEWVKPGPGDTPPTPGGRSSGSAKPKRASSYYQSHLQQPAAGAGPSMPSQFEGELYQDDEGRYWAVGSKTGQWYFFDHTGWHPAHEFRPAAPAQAYQTQPYQPPAYQPAPAPPYYQPQAPQSGQGYAPMPQTPSYPPASSPAQPYGAWTSPGPQPQAPQPPVQPQPAPVEMPARPSPTDTQELLKPPTGNPASGSWYYFDGKQWLTYSSNEPAEAPPPAPKMVLEQQAEPHRPDVLAGAKAAPAPKSEPVVAELFENEPAPEVVDVEVVTVLEAEPDDEPEPVKPEKPATSPLPVSEDVRPRRPRRTSENLPARPPVGADVTPLPRERTSAEPSRPVMPKRREAAQEPTIIIPTGAVASNITSPSAAAPSQAPSKPARPAQPGQQHRARENTLPMEPVQAPRPSTPAPSASVTQPLPQVPKTARPDTAPVRLATTASQVTQPGATPAAAAAAVPAVETQPKKTGYTLGDVLRAVPSTGWAVLGGIVVLLIVFALIVAGQILFSQTGLGGIGQGAAELPTPTLAAGPPNATPTPGPTPVTSPAATKASTPEDVITFSSPTLGMTLEYPQSWYRKEDDNWVIFSPSEDSLDLAKVKDASFWIGTNKDKPVPDLLTDLLAKFPSQVENLNEGTISIASQTWTSVQIRFDDENLGGPSIATLAVTSKDGAGYSLVAIAPAQQWNNIQPVFQNIIYSLRFGVEEVAQAPTGEATTQAGGTAAPTKQVTKSANPTKSAGTPTRPAATPTPTIAATATPLVYVVQEGDSLLAIANKFGVDIDLLASKNDIDDPAKLSIGEELVIPFTAAELEAYNSKTGAGGASSAPAATSESTAEEPAVAGGEAGEAATPAASSTEAASKPAPTPAPAGEAAPVSGKIVYAGFNPGMNSYDLWLADVATGEQTGIASEASQPAFNKDGSLLAYRSWGIATRGIFFRDFIGGRGGQVTRFVEDGLPSWAPDGMTFAFASRREGDRVPRIYVGNQLGENDFSINFQGEYVSTFPDGRLVVKGCLPSGDCGVFVVGPRGGGEVKISAEMGDTAPAVSPDGSKIAFMSSSRGATNWEVWVMNADGSNPQRLTNNGNNDGLPTWSPDGRSIAYVSDQGGVWAVWVMNADGSNQRKLFNMKGSPEGYVLIDKDNSKGWLEERISWAP